MSLVLSPVFFGMYFLKAQSQVQLYGSCSAQRKNSDVLCNPDHLLESA
jgi:hypothetical protein